MTLSPSELRRVRVHAVETIGSTAVLIGRDGTDEPVIALAGTALTRAVQIALARGEEPCVDLPTWAVLAETRPDPDPLTYDHDAASSIGQGLAEYALILALVAMVAVVSLLFLGHGLSGMLSAIAAAV